MPRPLAEQAVLNITGGLFALLNDFVSNYSKGKKMEDIINEKDQGIATILLDLRISHDHAVFHHIVAHERISLYDSRVLGMTKEMSHLLVDSNILATHPNGTLTFHDRQVKM